MNIGLDEFIENVDAFTREQPDTDKLLILDNQIKITNICIIKMHKKLSYNQTYNI